MQIQCQLRNIAPASAGDDLRCSGLLLFLVGRAMDALMSAIAALPSTVLSLTVLGLTVLGLGSASNDSDVIRAVIVGSRAEELNFNALG